MDIKRSVFAGIILAITAIAAIAFYLQNRVQTPLAQVTPEERDIVLQELKGIYILSTQPRASELAEDPKIKAQIELQYRATMAQAVATD